MLCGGQVTLTYGYYRNRLSYQSRSTYILYALFMVSGAANVYKTKGKNTKTIYEVWSNVRYYQKSSKNIKFRGRTHFQILNNIICIFTYFSYIHIFKKYKQY